ncbi:replication-relaxation family protein [Sporosarcina saromensis]|uniref:Replication-relaxation family protein n=1 Tax=Sporosarcina saromensis TaxID=359365 RepID=A0ABU4GDL7_9BACL|nr:replication-relaxation family protein [Sporosarcina saromensis]MDW0115070.1 replication-relaxation family protein [Sporosarcina saromensis]
MEYDKPLMTYTKDKKGRPGIHIYKEDLELLKQIYIHRTMRAVSIHELLKVIYKGERTTKAISKRLAKLTDSGVLIQMKHRAINNLHIFYYKLGTRGYEVLGKLASQGTEEQYSPDISITSTTIPATHTAATSTIANRVYLSCSAKNLLKGFQHWRGSQHPLFLNRMGEESYAEIVPDWVFEYEDTIVCVEVDTGYQRRHVIADKYKRYIELSQKEETQGKKIVVVFSVVDESVDPTFTYNRDRRIAKLKEYAPPIHEWGIMNNELNIHFYAVSAFRTPPLIVEILSGFLPIKREERYKLAEDWSRKVQKVYGERIRLSQLSNDEVFNPRRERFVDCECVFRMQNMNSGSEKTFAFLYGEEGSVFTYQLVRANAMRLGQLTEHTELPNPELLICYDAIENVNHNHYGVSFTLPVKEATYGQWIQAEMNKELPPQVKSIVSEFTKANVDLFK